MVAVVVIVVVVVAVVVIVVVVVVVANLVDAIAVCPWSQSADMAALHLSGGADQFKDQFKGLWSDTFIRLNICLVHTILLNYICIIQLSLIFRYQSDLIRI